MPKALRHRTWLSAESSDECRSGQQNLFGLIGNVRQLFTVGSCGRHLGIHFKGQLGGLLLLLIHDEEFSGSVAAVLCVPDEDDSFAVW